MINMYTTTTSPSLSFTLCFVWFSGWYFFFEMKRSNTIHIYTRRHKTHKHSHAITFTEQTIAAKWKEMMRRRRHIQPKAIDMTETKKFFWHNRTAKWCGTLPLCIVFLCCSLSLTADCGEFHLCYNTQSIGFDGFLRFCWYFEKFFEHQLQWFEPNWIIIRPFFIKIYKHWVISFLEYKFFKRLSCPNVKRALCILWHKTSLCDSLFIFEFRFNMSKIHLNGDEPIFITKTLNTNRFFTNFHAQWYIEYKSHKWDEPQASECWYSSIFNRWNVGKRASWSSASNFNTSHRASKTQQIFEFSGQNDRSRVRWIFGRTCKFR